MAEVQHAGKLWEDDAVEQVSAQQPEGKHAVITKGQACSCQAHQHHATTDHPLQLPLRRLQRGEVKLLSYFALEL